MAGGVPAGRLSIEIVAEIARLQQDLDKAKRAVKAASGDIASSARAANDNLSRIGRGAAGGVAEYSREVARLKGNLDPAWAALQRYKDQVGLLRRAQAEGAITQEEYREQLRLAKGEYQGVGNTAVAVGGKVTASAGAQRAGMQQLSYQLGDMATMYSLGASKMQIFASQGTQVIQAASLMTSGVGKLGAFLSGPWGIAVVAATTVLAPFIARLFDTADAAKVARQELQSAFEAFQNGLPKMSNLAAVMSGATRTIVEAKAKIASLQNDLSKISGSDAYKSGTFVGQQIKAQQRIIADANAKVKQAIDQSRILVWQQGRLATATEKTTKATAAHAHAAGRATKAISAETQVLKQAREAAEEFLDFTIRAAREVDQMAKAFMKDGQTLKDVLKQIAREKDAAFKAMEADAAAVNDRLREMADLLSQIGGVGSIIGDALNFLNGDFGSMRGSLGRLFNTSFQRKDGTAVKIGDELKSIFGLNGEFGKTLSTVLGNAGMGAAIGDTADKFMKALGIKSSNTGAQLGGAIGGAAFGPIGAIGGAVLGGLVGGLFKKTKKGTATIGAGFDIAIGGNSGSRKDAANAVAGDIVGAMKEIADALGGQLDKAVASVTIGIRKKSFVVDPTGQGRTKGAGVINFGQDQEAAIAYAIKDLINDGVITGIRQSTMNLLKAGTDLQSALDKALTFESVFAELKRRTDPLGYALDQIAAKFANLTAIFVEANATAEEMAALAQLRALEEADAQAQAAADAAAAAEAARQEALDRANEKLALEARLLAAQGDALGALAKQRAIELSQIDAANRALLQQIFQAEDVASAKQVLNDAYQRERGELEATADRMRQLGDSLRSVRAGLFDSGSSGPDYNQALVRLMSVGGLAGAGDEAALGQLGGVVGSFLDAARASARTVVDVRRAQGLAAGYLDRAIGFTDSAASNADRQLAALDAQVSQLIDINDGVVSVEQAIDRLTAAMGGTGTGASTSEDDDRRARILQAQIERLEARMAEVGSGLALQLRLQERLDRLLAQLTPDGDALQVTVTA